MNAQRHIVRSGVPGSGPLWVEVVTGLISWKAQALTLLDLCCGEMTASRELGFKSITAVDVHDWPLRPTHAEFIHKDVLSFDPEGRTWDVALCSDGIEHLLKENGHKLLKLMMAASRQQIIFTPLGIMGVHEESVDPDYHKSGWTPEDFPDWTTICYPNWHTTLYPAYGAFFAYRIAA